MTILERLCESQKFTSSEQSVIEFILEKPYLLTEMSIRELANATYTSNTTIIRICKKIGYAGYKDFKLAFLIEIESEKFFNKNVNFNTPFYQSESTSQIINSISSIYKESIDLVTQSLHIKTIEDICETFIQSKRIFIFAIGDSAITSQNFMNKLMKLNLYPILATNNYEEVAMAYNMTKDDCALFITYNGIYANFLTIAPILYRKNVPIITITANEESKLITYSCQYIVIPHKEYTNKIATFYSQISFEYILNILYSLIYHRNYSQHHKHKDIIDSLS